MMDTPTPGAQVIDLGGAWTLTGGGHSVPALVPGCVHTDLIRAGLAPDPLHAGAQEESRWIGQTDWQYTTQFVLPDLTRLPECDGPRIDLVADGLRTLARIEVNGVEVGHSANMHRRYRFDLAAVARPGRNDLSITFASTAHAMLAAAGEHPLPYDWAYPYNEVRTQACEVGWDWGPTAVSMGIWRDLRIEIWDVARAEVAVTATLDRDLRQGTVLITADVTTTGPGPVFATAVVQPAEQPDTQDSGTSEVTSEMSAGRNRLAVPVQDPELWWPRGYGAARLYDVEVTVRDSAGAWCQTTRHRVGFRHVDLDTAPDRYGRACTLRVNGRPVFAKGANWIPDDVLVTRVDADRYARRIDQAVAAGMNTLRVWGGGIYEDDSFYAECDRRGMVVWQDFMFACAAYPESATMRDEIRAEADDAVRRLATHPAVVVWNGGNECELGYADWGWPPRIGDRPWGRTYYREMLPEAVARQAPGAVYVPNSPFSSGPGVHPQVPGDGTVHLWDTWNLLDYAHYRDEIPRFVAEFGWQAPATWRTLSQTLGSMPARPDDPALTAHQKQPSGSERLVDRLAGRFPEPWQIATDTDRWHHATSLNQADALRTAIEHFRSWWPRTAGALVWQLNDVWPAISWSLIDHGERPKPAWHAVRRAFSDRLVTLQPREEGLCAILVNDHDEPWQGELLIRRVHVTDGDQVRTVTGFAVGARSVAVLPVPADLTQASARRDELIVADVLGSGDLPEGTVPEALRAVHALVRADGVRWPVPRPRCTVSRTADAIKLSVHASAALGDVSVQVDRLHPAAVVDSALVTILPGESQTFVVSVPRESPDAGALAGIADAAVIGALRTRNELFHA